MFTILKPIEEVVQSNEYKLDVVTKKLLTDAFVISKDEESFIVNCGILNVFQNKAPDNWVNYALGSYHKKLAISEKVLEIMRGQCVKEVVEEETIFYPVPTTKTALTNLAFTFFPDCSKESFAYNIDMIIKWCDGKGNATWNDFVNAFKQ